MESKLEEAKQSMESLINVYKQLNLNGKQKAYYDWVFANGKVFVGINKLLPQGKMKFCYYNSQMYALENKQAKYYEGWGITEGIGIPLEHGFNVIEEQAYDKTWNNGLVYFGIHIPTKWVQEYVVKTSMADNLMYRYVMSILEKT